MPRERRVDERAVDRARLCPTGPLVAGDVGTTLRDRPTVRSETMPRKRPIQRRAGIRSEMTRRKRTIPATAGAETMPRERPIRRRAASRSEMTRRKCPILAGTAETMMRRRPDVRFADADARTPSSDRAETAGRQGLVPPGTMPRERPAERRTGIRCRTMPRERAAEAQTFIAVGALATRHVALGRRR